MNKLTKAVAGAVTAATLTVSLPLPPKHSAIAAIIMATAIMAAIAASIRATSSPASPFSAALRQSRPH
jgi:hypothetical protein